ncbi:MAG: TadE/TadG family type IV pilus assembly protein [Oscillochloridaceae bacterium umkhey_bin13]
MATNDDRSPTHHPKKWGWRVTRPQRSQRNQRLAPLDPFFLPEPDPVPVPALSSQAQRNLRVLAALQRRNRQRGQAIVEFVIVLGLFLSLIFFLVAVGQILLANYTVTQAARAAAHQAALAGGSSDAARLAAHQVLDSGVGTSSDGTKAAIAIVCANPDGGTPASVCRRYYPVTVTVDYTDSFWVPVPVGGGSFTVRAQATRAAERDQQ